MWAQPKWGDDTRLSIRGSGLSRNFHLRGVQLFMDGIPINTADGYGDFQEIDPTAYRYVEVYKGANALRFGANSLGGAINFVTPTGRDAALFDGRIDAGSFGYLKAAASSGAAFGPFDYYVNGSAQRLDGYRDHSWGTAERAEREPRLPVHARRRDALLRERQRGAPAHPGSVTKASALNSPTTAAAANVLMDSSATSTRCGSPTRQRSALGRPRSTSASSASTAT